MRRVFTFVIPAIFLNYYPALFFWTKPDPFNFPSFALYSALCGRRDICMRPDRMALRHAPLSKYRDISNY